MERNAQAPTAQTQTPCGCLEPEEKLARWASFLPVKPGVKRSWLNLLRSANGDVHFGCTLCEKHREKRCQDKLALFAVDPSHARLANFRRHAAGHAHRAIAALEPQPGDTSVTAPPPEVFQALWDQLGGRPSCGDSCLDMSKRKRFTIEWCIFEALRDKERDMLSKAATISVAMDERNDRLLVTYAASNKTDVRSGVLAQLRSPGRTADEVACCVALAVGRLCTRRPRHPHMYTPQEAQSKDDVACEHILHQVEMFSADGAANEQLAGRLLHPAVERAGTAEKLPNLKMILRDKAHAARRLTQRTFKVDPLLDELQRTMLFGVDGLRGASVAKMLRDSGPCADIFAREVEQQHCREGPVGAVKHIGFAKHRFDNTAKPLAVAIWNLDAVISSCDIIARDHTIHGKFRNVATAFLMMLRPETILLLGMMADASDEVLALVRFFDKEAFEVDSMAEAVQTFKRNLNAMFRSEVCLHTGFTQLCLKHLHTRKVIVRPGGKVESMCGPHMSPETFAAVTRNCLQRMVAWVRLVEEVASTEFPAWELLGAFSVFRLADVPTRGPRVPLRPPMNAISLAVDGCAQQRLCALASAFGVDDRELVEEFQDHRRVAQGIKNTRPEMNSMQAWRECLSQTQRSRKSKQTWPARALLPIAERYFVCPGSTSGIEQAFSLLKRIVGQQWHASELAEDRHFVLALRARRDKMLPDSLLASARQIWTNNFGASRKQQKSLGTRARLLLADAGRGRLRLLALGGWHAGAWRLIRQQRTPHRRLGPKEALRGRRRTRPRCSISGWSVRSGLAPQHRRGQPRREPLAHRRRQLSCGPSTGARPL